MSDATQERSSDAETTPVVVNGQDEFDDLVDSADVLLVDFHADWCGPCKMIEPIVERIAAETDATVASVDVDDNQGLAATYGVRGVPTLLLFADGEQVEQVVGVQPEERLRSLVTGYTE